MIIPIRSAVSKVVATLVIVIIGTIEVETITTTREIALATTTMATIEPVQLTEATTTIASGAVTIFGEMTTMIAFNSSFPIIWAIQAELIAIVTRHWMMTVIRLPRKLHSTNNSESGKNNL